ncbi:hypothetical protein BN2475_1050012 [Paraburkholderia ribeironis]|uniref:Uncharacterized protein n=1 Tax=Paraburkholderia ribeironis TaxID=1247936 RepID=A0A1N7SMC2_9BURK|nr:hypothetical protein BN2475_1050012 [Paraburkholderia ribeironis]
MQEEAGLKLGSKIFELSDEADQDTANYAFREPGQGPEAASLSA